VQGVPPSGHAAAPLDAAPKAPAAFRSITATGDLADELDRFQEAVADKVRAARPSRPLPAPTDIAPAARAALAAWLADASPRAMAAALEPEALDTGRVGVEIDSPFPGGLAPPGPIAGGPGAPQRRPFTATPGATTAPPDGREQRAVIAQAPGERPPGRAGRTVHASIPVRPRDAKVGVEATVSVALTFDEKSQKWTAGPVSVSADGDLLKDAMQKVRSAK